MKKKILILLYIFLLSCPITKTSAQVINTIAGTAIQGYTGDGGPATAARVYLPISICLDSAGNIYFAEFSNHIIRKVNTAGIISTVAGDGTAGYSGDGAPATSAQLNFPSGVMVDNAGNIYVGDYGNHRIRKINTSGVISTIAGNGTAFFSGDGGNAMTASLHDPTGVAMDHSGNIYICDKSNHRVRKIDNLGIITTIAGTGVPGYTGDGGPATAAQLNGPAGISIDGYDNLLIADKWANAIRKITPSGIITTVAGTGIAGFSGDGGPATAAQIDSATDVKVDVSGNLYIADDNNNRIRKVNISGIMSTIAGTGVPDFFGDGGNPLLARMFGPNGVATDRTGNVYVADFHNNCVREISAVDQLPRFTGGHVQHFTICENAGLTPIDAYLAVADSDTAQILTWSVLQPPAHGSVIAGFMAIAQDDTVSPSGLTFTPATGYNGPDSFQIRVFDGFRYDTTTIRVTITPLPNTGTITGPPNVCVGSFITLSDTVSGGIWHSANGSATITTAGLLTGVSNGVDTISYTVTSGGCTNVTHKPILIGPLLSSYFGGPTSVCAGSSIIISAPVDSGTWTSNAPAIASFASVSASSAIITGLTAGTAVLTYTLTNNCGTGHAYDTITVHSVPVLSTTLTPAAICDNTPFSYAPGSAAAGATFVWQRDSVAGITNAPASGTNSITETLHNSTTAPLNVTYHVTTSAGGCADTQQVTVVVKPTPALSGPLADTMCNGRIFSYFAGSNTAGTSFTWVRPVVSGVTPATAAGTGNITDTLFNTIAGYVQVVYHYTLTANGCTNNQDVTLTLTPNAPAPVIATHSPSIVCTGTMFQNFGLAAAPVAGVSYTWSATGGAAIWAPGNTLQYCLVNFNEPGQSTVYINASLPGNNCTSRDSFTVIVGENTPAVQQVLRFDNNFTCIPGEALTYQWGYDDAATLDSTLLTGETNQNYFNPAPDYSNKYYWVTTMRNSCPQKTYFIDPLSVTAATQAPVQAAVYPNPSTGAFSIKLPSATTTPVALTVTDIVGRKIKEYTITTNQEHELWLDAPAGMYLLTGTTSAGRFTARLQIVK